MSNYLGTTSNKASKKPKKLILNTKKAKSESKVNKLFGYKKNDKNNIKIKNNIISRNETRNILYFNKNDKQRIYKNYFSVEGTKNYKNKNEKYNNNDNTNDHYFNRYFRTLNNGYKKYNSINQKKYILKEIINNSNKVNNKQKINTNIINQKKLFWEINKYKDKINKLKKQNSILKRKIEYMKEVNKNIKISLENRENDKESIILNINKLMISIDYINFNNFQIENKDYDLFNLMHQIKNEFKDKKIINDIIELIRKLYLEYNYSFSSNETKKIINFNEISYNILWDWFKNIPKLIFYEKIKNNLDKNKTNMKNYEEFIQYLFTIFGVNSIKKMFA